jgi:hypothetical protein
MSSAMKLLILGTAAIGGLGMYLAKFESDRLFEAEFAEVGMPRTKADLHRYWARARAAREEDYAEGLEARAIIFRLQQHADAARRLEQTLALVYDATCDPQVAAWMLIGALRQWARVFGADESLIDDDGLALAASIRELRANGGPVGTYVLRYVPREASA